MLMSFMSDVYGQIPQLYSVSSGLKTCQIAKIYQDSDGLIWTVSDYGLERFDGTGFVYFSYENDNPYGLNNEYVNDIVEDVHGYKWVATDHGVDIYDDKRHMFSPYEIQSETAGLNTVTNLKHYLAGNHSYVFIATEQHGIFVIDSDTRKVDVGRTDALNKCFPYRGGILFLDSKGRLWSYNKDVGLMIYDCNEELSVTVSIKDNIEKGNHPLVYAEDEATGDVYIGTRKGLYIVDDDKKVLRRSKGERVFDKSITSMAFDNAGTMMNRSLFLGVDNNGVHIYDVEEEDIIEDGFLALPFRLDDVKANYMLQDKQGNLWVAAFPKGLIMIPRQDHGFQTHVFNHNNIPGYNASSITAVELSADGSETFIGTDGSGLFVMDESGKYKSFNMDNSDLTSNAITDIVSDKRGGLWIASYGGGVICCDPSNGMKMVTQIQELKNKLIWKIGYDPAYDILYVGTHRSGMYIIDAETQRIIEHFDTSSLRSVSSFYLDEEGLMWIGTYSDLYYYSPKDNVIRRFNVDYDTSQTYATCVCKSSDGTLWLGTRKGLYEYTKEGRLVRVWTESDGLESSIIKSMVVDGEDNLWISSIIGITYVDTQTKEVNNYYSSALSDNEFRSDVSAVSLHHVYFGGSNGLTFFAPAHLKHQSQKMPDIFITSLVMMGERIEYDPAGENFCLEQSLLKADSIRIPRECDSFTLTFTVPEFTYMDKVRYEYRLNPSANTKWERIESGNILTLTNVRKRKNDLEIRAFYEGFTDGYSVRQLSIEVQQRWYNTVAAYVIYLLLAITAYMLFLRYKKNRLKQQEKDKESEINRMKVNMFSNLTHEIRTPLFLVLSPLSKLIEVEKESKVKDIYNRMYRNGLRIRRIVNQFLDMQKIDENQFKLAFVHTRIAPFVRDIMESFDSLVKMKNVNFTLDMSSEDLSLWVDPVNFDKVLFNVLSNAFKHVSDKGKIHINISEIRSEIDGQFDNRFVDISIANTGSHISEGNIGKIFQRFFQENPSDDMSGTGIGLSLAKSIVELHHGKIWAENNADGVVFVIRMPYGKSHLTEYELTSNVSGQEFYLNSLHRDNGFINDSLCFQKRSRSNDKRRRIVIVDDDGDTRYYVSQIFKDYAVETCCNGEEALQIVSTRSTDAIIMDFKMNAMDGYKLCRSVRSNPSISHIPIIVLTSSDDEETEIKCSELGVDRYFVKPVSARVLLNSVVQAVSTRERLLNRQFHSENMDYQNLKVSSSDERLKNKVLEVIKDNLSNPNFGVEELGKEVGLSRVHLNRKIKSIMNITVSSLIRSMRLKQAAFLLLNTEKVNVSEVAYSVGYSSLSHFSVAFKEFYGRSPLSFINYYSEIKDQDVMKKIIEGNYDDRYII